MRRVRAVRCGSASISTRRAFCSDLREFNLVEERETDGVRRRIYRTAGDPVIEVEMRISGSEKGYESTNYEGVLIESASGESVDFKGDCGV
jgi:hypothetical protein